ncbi:hypothetical protein BBJ28_00002211 [Nothophytophthora sp. Chile5]|nr:hypothetical protein BBJ28_00002211 [Nothophytophthora sp. Chile5]
MDEPMTAGSTAYLDGNCTTSPVSTTVGYAANCVEVNCTALPHGQATLQYSTTCHTLKPEAHFSMSDSFAGLNYLVADAFTDSECSKHNITRAFAIQTCEPYELLASSSSVIVSMADESAQLDVFEDADCTSSPTETTALDRSTLSWHSCSANTMFNIHTNGSSSASSRSGNVSTNVTNASSSDDGSSSVETPTVTASSDLPLTSERPAEPSAAKTCNPSGNRWEDPVILAIRIPRERLRLEQVSSCNRGGMVYSGTYNGQYVVIKKLLPERQHTIPRVNALLIEAKLMAALEHPHVISLLGVAWSSLLDMSVVTEFMGGGTLKALLIALESQRCSLG